MNKKKKIYREELKQKLKNKQNELKAKRTNNLIKPKITNETNFNESIGKLTEIMKNIEPVDLETLNLDLDLNSKNNTIEQQTDIIKEEILINNISNQTNKTENLTIEQDNFDDYLN